MFDGEETAKDAISKFNGKNSNTYPVWVVEDQIMHGIVCSKSTKMLYQSILGYVLNGITLVAEIAKDSDKKKR